jgi:hypothetical protein
MMDFDELLGELEMMFDIFIEDTGASLGTDAKELADLAAKLSKTLAKSRGKSGWDIGFAAAVDVMAMEAGIASVNQADALDARLLGMIDAALRLGSKALVAVL